MASVPDRAIPFSRVFNFRDLGGYPTIDGRTVAWRRLFRSDDLSRLTGDDAERFAGLGIRTVVDLRRPTEVAELGRVPSFAGVDYRHIHLVHQLWPPAEHTGPDDRVAFLIDRYREMAIEAREGIGEALRVIAEADAAPLVVHCIAGKDRTGIVAALTLYLLGVDEDAIIHDYTLSEPADASIRALLGKEPSRFPAAPAAVMHGFLSWLREHHGSVEAYVKSIGVTDDHITAMRAHLLT
ncbi:MAG: tyrosine-protein phosphatase [Micromonosporaceae bacterium]|nr:tyrosine-protein phosphatase [Micromonosporaceae bacterium]